MTILRATQFHEFVLRMIQFLDHLPVMMMPKGFLLQPIDIGEVADRLVELAPSGPVGLAPDIGGPEVRTAAEFARAYLEAAGRSRRVVEVPVPGKWRAPGARERKYPPSQVWQDHLGGVLGAYAPPKECRLDDKKGFGMKTRHKGHSMRRAWIRAGLLFLAATTLNGSLWALPFPRSFYEDFPLPGRDWVSTLGPYDEHLVRDYGALNLALGILLVAAAIFLERRVSQVAFVAWLGYAVPHLVFHTTLTEHFSPFDNLAQLGSLGLQVLLPLVMLAVTGALPQEGKRALQRDADPQTGETSVS